MKRLIWSRPAKEDLEPIHQYLLAEQPQYIVSKFEAVRDAALFLSETPSAGTRIDGVGRRKWRISGTPYVLIYRFTKGEVQILRVHHVRQNWRPRS